MKNKINEITVSYLNKSRKNPTKKIVSSVDAAKVLFEHWNKNTIGLHESFKIVLLSNANTIKGIYELSSGGITGTLVDLRILFAVVLKTLATGIILVHNHPSGVLKPSSCDKKITEKIQQVAKLFDVKIVDHIILNSEGDYFSFSDEGIL